MNRKTSLILAIFLVITLLFVAVNIYYATRIFDRSEKLSQSAASFIIPEFSAINQEGQPSGSEQLKNKVWVANFVFTRCPGPCLQMTKNMAKLQQYLGSESEVKLVTFTVDPEHDRPNILKEYGTVQGADWQRWTFLTGNRAEMHDLIQKGFKLNIAEATAQEAPDTGPFIHSTLFVVVSRDGKTAGYINGAADDFFDQIKKVINQAIKIKS